MRALCVHAHFDDFELTAAGTFELWRRQLGSDFSAKVLVCTDGEAGHHQRSREETGRLRMQEQEASARIGGYAFEVLRYPDGTIPREGCIQPGPEFLAGLWKAIRDFQPDYLFSPPLPTDPLTGVHVDHVAVAEAVRKVAYLINVPHAFSPEYPTEAKAAEPCRVPTILNVWDSYIDDGAVDLVVDIEEAFSAVCEMAYCHQTQIMEWIPWVGRHRMRPPESFEDWSGILRERYRRHQAKAGIPTSRMVEMFTVTAWGEIPGYERLVGDFPNLLSQSDTTGLREKLARWGS